MLYITWPKSQTPRRPWSQLPQMLNLLFIDSMEKVTPPQFLYLQLNQRCDLRCKTCLYWTHNDSDYKNYISIEKRREILREFHSLNAHGSVVICGGNTMLDTENYFSTTNAIRLIGLNCICVINGMQILTANDADRMINKGPHEITVSLDSHIKEIHNWIRGSTESYDNAVNALKLLIKARVKAKSNSKIFAMAIINELNYKSLDAFYDFVLNTIGADKLKLNFLQPTFETPHNYDHKFFRDMSVHDVNSLIDLILFCDTKYNLKINPKWLLNVRCYLESIHTNKTAGWRSGWGSTRGTSQVICNSGERNIMIDLYGKAKLCFSPRFSSVQLNTFGDLKAFWTSKLASEIRSKMSTCTAYCGISHSTRRESATLK